MHPASEHALSSISYVLRKEFAACKKAHRFQNITVDCHFNKVRRPIHDGVGILAGDEFVFILNAKMYIMSYWRAVELVVT